MTGKIKQWIEYARNKYHRYVKLVADPGSAEGVMEIIKAHPINELQGMPGKDYVCVLYESGKAGEASARPHLRIANCRAQHMKNCIRGVLMAQGDGPELPAGHLFFILDGKIGGNTEAAHKCFVDSNAKLLPKIKKAFYIQTSEESERETKAHDEH